MAENRGLKTRSPLSSSVNTELLTKLRNLSFETSVPISKLLDKAIELVLNEYEKPAKK